MKLLRKAAAVSASLLLSLDFTHAHPVVPDASGTELVQRAKPLLPSQDPFYAVPANLSDYKPGQIIRSRKPPFPLAAYGAPIKLASSWQLFFRTTDAFGEPLTAATTIMMPYNADLTKFLSYQVEIDAAYEGAFPSYTLQQPAQDLDNINTRYGIIWALPILEKGYPVVFPDYVGANAAWVAGPIEGHVTLDGVRAVRQSTSTTGITSDAKAFGWGYSGGAHATLWAMETAPDYAPDAVFEATALGGIAPDVPSIIQTTNKGIAAGIAFTGIVGVSHGYPVVKDLLDDQILPEKADEFSKISTQGLIPNVVQFAYKDLFSYFKNGSALLEVPQVKEIIARLSAGNGAIFKGPSYWYQATNDEVIPIQTVKDLKDKYCAAGANIEFVEEALGEHIVMAVTGGYKALKFMSDRMDGKEFKQKGCSYDKVTTTLLDPNVWPYLIKQGGALVKSILGGAIGLKFWVENGGAA